MVAAAREGVLVRLVVTGWIGTVVIVDGFLLNGSSESSRGKRHRSKRIRILIRYIASRADLRLHRCTLTYNVIITIIIIIIISCPSMSRDGC